MSMCARPERRNPPQVEAAQAETAQAETPQPETHARRPACSGAACLCRIAPQDTGRRPHEPNLQGPPFSRQDAPSASPGAWVGAGAHPVR